MTSISANELKVKGVSALEAILRDEDEAIISVRGKNKYVIIDLKRYDKIREYELDIALLEAKVDIANDRVIKESVEAHMKRVID